MSPGPEVVSREVSDLQSTRLSSEKQVPSGPLGRTRPVPLGARAPSPGTHSDPLQPRDSEVTCPGVGVTMPRCPEPHPVSEALPVTIY